jgi:uncharacterized lipoprotein YmbA
MRTTVIVVLGLAACAGEEHWLQVFRMVSVWPICLDRQRSALSGQVCVNAVLNEPGLWL